MGKYMIRRFFQMILVVLLSTVAIYVLLNIAPGGPLAGLGLGGVRVAPTEADMARLQSYLGLDKPILLRYLTWLIGDDWLGADWAYIGLGSYRYPALDKNGQQLFDTNPDTGVKTPRWNYARFWTDPGPALLKPGDMIWVWGYDAGQHQFYADSLLVNPPTRVGPPDDLSAFGSVLIVTAQTITIQDANGIRSTAIVDQYTTYSFPIGEGLPRPQRGWWLNISWLTGSTGWLGRYDGFHGTYRGILRLDFSRGWCLGIHSTR